MCLEVGSEVSLKEVGVRKNGKGERLAFARKVSIFVHQPLRWKRRLVFLIIRYERFMNNTMDNNCSRVASEERRGKGGGARFGSSYLGYVCGV